MRISAIQNQIQAKTMTRKVLRKNETEPQTQLAAPAFKGGDGALVGLGGGLITGLLIFAGGAITGGLALPAILGCAGVLGCGAAGAAAGNKIEDKIKGKK